MKKQSALKDIVGFLNENPITTTKEIFNGVNHNNVTISEYISMLENRGLIFKYGDRIELIKELPSCSYDYFFHMPKVDIEYYQERLDRLVSPTIEDMQCLTVVECLYLIQDKVFNLKVKDLEDMTGKSKESWIAVMRVFVKHKYVTKTQFGYSVKKRIPIITNLSDFKKNPNLRIKKNPIIKERDWIENLAREMYSGADLVRYLPIMRSAATCL